MEDRYTNFTRLMLNISRCVQKIKKVEMEKLGFKGNQVEVLLALSQRKEGLNFAELCEACDEDKAAISRTVKDLTSKGLLLQEGEQKYKNNIKLTDQGREVGRLVCGKIEDFIELGSRGVSLKEREKMYEILEKISKNLTKICQKGE